MLPPRTPPSTESVTHLFRIQQRELSVLSQVFCWTSSYATLNMYYVWPGTNCDDYTPWLVFLDPWACHSHSDWTWLACTLVLEEESWSEYASQSFVRLCWLLLFLSFVLFFHHLLSKKRNEGVWSKRGRKRKHWLYGHCNCTEEGQSGPKTEHCCLDALLHKVKHPEKPRLHPSHLNRSLFLRPIFNLPSYHHIIHQFPSLHRSFFYSLFARSSTSTLDTRHPTRPLCSALLSLGLIGADRAPYIADTPGPEYHVLQLLARSAW